jgi:hypothetical protein
MVDQKLPRIVEILRCKDHGPCDDGASATCPHCGAEGRYVYSFRCEDGSTRGAMKGCIKLFPMHPLARVMTPIITKEREVGKKNAYGGIFKLNKWDTAISEAVRAWLDGRMTEQQATSIVNAQLANKKMWIKQKFGGR